MNVATLLLPLARGRKSVLRAALLALVGPSRRGQRRPCALVGYYRRPRGKLTRQRRRRDRLTLRCCGVGSHTSPRSTRARWAYSASALIAIWFAGRGGSTSGWSEATSGHERGCEGSDPGRPSCSCTGGIAALWRIAGQHEPYEPAGGRPHDALDALATGIVRRRVSWVLDADFRDYFSSLDHRWLERFLEHRIADRRVLRLVQKWLRAGVIENGSWTAYEERVPQGASASPLLANVYLRYGPARSHVAVPRVLCVVLKEPDPVDSVAAACWGKQRCGS